jgi:hypothetical protein
VIVTALKIPEDRIPLSGIFQHRVNRLSMLGIIPILLYHKRGFCQEVSENFFEFFLCEFFPKDFIRPTPHISANPYRNARNRREIGVISFDVRNHSCFYYTIKTEFVKCFFEIHVIFLFKKIFEIFKTFFKKGIDKSKSI